MLRGQTRQAARASSRRRSITSASWACTGTPEFCRRYWSAGSGGNDEVRSFLAASFGAASGWEGGIVDFPVVPIHHGSVFHEGSRRVSSRAGSQAAIAFAHDRRRGRQPSRVPLTGQSNKISKFPWDFPPSGVARSSIAATPRHLRSIGHVGTIRQGGRWGIDRSPPLMGRVCGPGTTTAMGCPC